METSGIIKSAPQEDSSDQDCLGMLPGKILVVDDCSDLRSIMEFMLRRAGYEVLLADGGEEALTQIKEHSKGLDLVCVCNESASCRL